MHFTLEKNVKLVLGITTRIYTKPLAIWSNNILPTYQNKQRSTRKEKAKLVNVIGDECNLNCKLNNFYCKLLSDKETQFSLLPISSWCQVDEFFLIMTLIYLYLPFNALRLNLRFYDKWTIIRKKISPVPFLGNFWNLYFK